MVIRSILFSGGYIILQFINLSLLRDYREKYSIIESARTHTHTHKTEELKSHPKWKVEEP